MRDNRENVHQAAEEAVKGKLLFWRVVSSVLLLAVIALGVLLYLAKSAPVLPPETPPEETPAEAVRYTAWCYAPQGDPQQVSGLAGEEISLPDGPQIDGYTFLGWSDANGAEVEGGKTTLYADAAFSANYAIAFRDESGEKRHEPYLAVDDEGYFHPLGKVSRADAAVLLYSLLDTELQGSAEFTDLDPSSPAYAAAATLKDLGVIGGARFHPDDPISLGELFEMLAHFFPGSTADCAFDSIPESDPLYGPFCLAMERGWISDASVSPDEELTRAAAARIFNRLRGRAPTADENYAKVGTILDVSFADPDFWDIAEAAIAHDAAVADGSESWGASEALPLLDEGLFFIGTALHCIDADGGAVVNGSYGNFDFGPDGVITTGMPELDALVQDKLAELVDPSSMEPERMLHIVYDYVTYSNNYLGIHFYEVGDISWVNAEAYHMLTQHKGNCYNFSSEFYVLAKAIGFDAQIFSGTIEPNSSPHAWVEIETDGVPYIYDTELEYTQVIFQDSTSSYFKAPLPKMERWHYYKGD